MVINEDTTQTAGLWATARTKATITYLSPEMALSNSFAKLWKDATYRKRLTAVIVDEAHCIEDWGADDFRPLYRQLGTLRNYTGLDIPFLACTATCSTQTFNTIWSTLAFGHRPFWGLDVGTERPNLLFLTRQLENPKNPMLDILNILPQLLSGATPLEALAKCLFYFDSEKACREAVTFIRKCLPPHLRDAVHAFSSDLSEEGKTRCWEMFMDGRIRILCATDAAGMGCNVTDVKYVVLFGIPKSVGNLTQRWGRAGRDRKMEATCLVLVPPWAFRPAASLNPSVEAIKGKGKKLESKRSAVNRANLDSNLERFLNLAFYPQSSRESLISPGSSAVTNHCHSLLPQISCWSFPPRYGFNDLLISR